jgi:hypothetical protein
MNKRKSVKRTRGGSAWQYTKAVYGAANEQVSDPAGGNVIAANNLSGKTTGGKRHNKRKHAGSGILTNIAVPAVLLYANNVVKFNKSQKKGYKGRKTRRNNRKLFR